MIAGEVPVDPVLALADWIGAHVLGSYLAGLAVVLAAAVLAGSIIRRAGRCAAAPAGESVQAGAALVAGLLPRIVAGFALVAAGAALFVEMLEAFDADESIGRFDTRLAGVLAQTASPAVLRTFGVATRLGDPWTLAGLVAVTSAVLLWRGRAALAGGFIVATAGSGLANRLLKGIFERVRPLHEHGYAVADGFSFPSGHTSGSVVVYGMLAYLALRLAPSRAWLPMLLLAAGLAYSMGISRVVLQVHWASDVIAGFGAGIAWLVVCIFGIEAMRHWRRR